MSRIRSFTLVVLIVSLLSGIFATNAQDSTNEGVPHCIDGTYQFTLVGNDAVEAISVPVEGQRSQDLVLTADSPTKLYKGDWDFMLYDNGGNMKEYARLTDCTVSLVWKQAVICALSVTSGEYIFGIDSQWVMDDGDTVRFFTYQDGTPRPFTYQSWTSEVIESGFAVYDENGCSLQYYPAP